MSFRSKWAFPFASLEAALSHGRHVIDPSYLHINLSWVWRSIAVTSYERHDVWSRQEVDCLFNWWFRLINDKEIIKASYYWPMTDGFLSQRASNEETVSMSWRHHAGNKLCRSNVGPALDRPLDLGDLKSPWIHIDQTSIRHESVDRCQIDPTFFILWDQSLQSIPYIIRHTGAVDKTSV